MVALLLLLLLLPQAMTFDSWASGVMRPLANEKPFAWVDFVSFMM